MDDMVLDMLFMGIDPKEQMRRLHEVGIICKEFTDKIAKFTPEEQKSALCMLFDMMFEENSVEVAEECIKNIREVNESMGAYHEDKK